MVTWEVDTLESYPWLCGLQDLCGTLEDELLVSFGGGLDAVSSLEMLEDFQECYQGNSDQMLLPVSPICHSGGILTLPITSK